MLILSLNSQENNPKGKDSPHYLVCLSRLQLPQENLEDQPVFMTSGLNPTGEIQKTSQLYLGCECVDWFGTYLFVHQFYELAEARHAA